MSVDLDFLYYVSLMNVLLVLFLSVFMFVFCHLLSIFWGGFRFTVLPFVVPCVLFTSFFVFSLPICP